MKKPQSEVYLVMHKDKHGNPRVYFSLVESLNEARKATLTREPTENAPRAPQPEDANTALSPFLKLMRETSREIEVFRSFYGLLSFIFNSQTLVQYLMTMEPVLNKYSNVVEDNNERTIFIITKANLQPITKALTQTTNSITAATQLPELVLMGLVGAYDVILQKLVKTGLKYEDRIAFGSDKTVRLRDLKGFSTIQEAMDFLPTRRSNPSCNRITSIN